MLKETEATESSQVTENKRETASSGHRGKYDPGYPKNSRSLFPPADYVPLTSEQIRTKIRLMSHRIQRVGTANLSAYEAQITAIIRAGLTVNEEWEPKKPQFPYGPLSAP